MSSSDDSIEPSPVFSTKEMNEILGGGSISVEAVCNKIKHGEIKRIVVLNGAGVSVSCGIPDFRSPGTGLYSQLEKYNLPQPEAVFDLDYFLKTNGSAFYLLSKEMWPDNFNPSPAHAFIRLLQDKNLLHRCFTQNIDTLERAAGVLDERIIEAHGSFASASCTSCGENFDQEECKSNILNGENLPIRCKVEDCDGIVKPDIVFFGEDLPMRFKVHAGRDLQHADLVIIMGTSLSVHPFAGLIHLADPKTPRLFINMVPAGVRGPQDKGHGLRLRQWDNYRDVMMLGKCDDGVRAICDFLGWRNELEALVEQIGSIGGPKFDEPIDLDACFPEMVGGLSYNWRVKTDELPVLKQVLPLSKYTPEHIGMLENDAELFMNSTTITEYGSENAILAIANATWWDEDDYIAFVPKDCTQIPYDNFGFHSYIYAPKRKDNILLFQKNITFRNDLWNAEDEKVECELWLVSNEQGKIKYRWGPFTCIPQDELEALQQTNPGDCKVS